MRNNIRGILVLCFLLLSQLIPAQTYFQKVRHPELFQGAHQSKKYFEGWYFKNISSDTSAAWAIIPGIAYDKKKNKKAFIQFINGKTAQTNYFEFDISLFHFSKDSFHISIGKNTFSKTGLHLDIEQDNHRIMCDLRFTDLVTLPAQSLLSANVMGPFALMPMQCKHGICSMQHRIMGNLEFDGTTYHFNDGKGYLEKDWGKSFPEKYVWLQSNHFANQQTSLSVSIASIPKLGFHFTGLLAVLYTQGEYHQFYTYNSTKIKTLNVDDNKARIELKRRKKRLVIEVERRKSGALQAPTKGNMDRKIAESIDAIIHYQLFKGDKIISEGTGCMGGLEIVNMTETKEK